jgi:autotransporter-associated beta strand protein
MSVGGGGGNGGFSGSVALGEGGSDPNKASTSISVSVGGDGGGGDVAGAVSVGTVQNALKANIQTLGVEASGIQAQSLGGGGGNGGFSFAGGFNLVPSAQGANTDVAIAVGGGGGNGDNASAVLVHHEGDIFTSGDGAHGIEAQSIGGGGGNGGGAHTLVLQLGPKPTTDADKKAANKNKALSLGIGGTGGGASNGSTVTIDHTGDITTVGGDAHGIFAQSIGGGGGSGGQANEGIPELFGLPLNKLMLRKYNREKAAWSGKSLDIVVGGRGGSSGDGDAVKITNNGVITTYGDSSHGVYAQSIGGGGGDGGAGELGFTGTVGVGGGAGSTGNGGTININLAGAVNTFGNAANAIYAQSIGGGGGTGGPVDRGLKNYLNIGFGLGFGGGGGNGGDGGTVAVNSTANLFTIGVGSYGIFAQSVGGGGGVGGQAGDDFPILNVMSFAGSTGGTGSGGIVNVTQSGNVTTLGDAADGIFAQSAGGQQTGKAVNVTLNSGSILASGAESNGIFAQSSGLGGQGNVSVTIANANSVVQGGTNTGAAVRFADGIANTLTNHGTLTTMGGIAGTSIVAGAGSETVDNFGTVNGSIDLGAGTNVFNNKSTGVFNTGTLVALGSHSTLNNAGMLSVGGAGNVQTTTLTGNLTQSGAPKWFVDLGAGGASDRLALTGIAQLGTGATTLDFNALAIPAASAYTLATAASGLHDAKFQFGTYFGDMPLGQTFGIATTATQAQLTMRQSTGLFRWTGRAGNVWIAPFVDGKSNWATDPSGEKYVYGTPGALTDVLIAQGAGISQLGADLSVNSLRFSNANTQHLDTIVGGDNTLTVMAHDGVGVTIDAGGQTTTLGFNVSLGNNQLWTNNSSGLFNVAGATIRGAHDLTIGGSGATRIGAAIQIGTGSLTKEGDDVLVVAGQNTYSGGTFVKAGTVLGNAQSLQGTIVNDAVVAFDETGVGTYTGSMSGRGMLVKQDEGMLVLGGTNSYSGGTIVSAGALQGTTRSLQGDILDAGSLIFSQGDSGTYAGSLFGAGSLFVRGGGSFNFTGNSSGFAGATTVAGSRLSVNGWLGGTNLLMQSGSTLGGNGIVPAVTLQSGATLAPGNSIGTLSVNGDTTFDLGSVYQVETQAYGPSDLTLISGRLFASGAIVDVRAGGTRRYQPINRYLIAMTGGDVATRFAGVTSDLSYLVPSLQYDVNHAYLTLRRNDVDFRENGTQGNQSAVAAVFNQLVPIVTGAFADTINSVFDLTAAQARHAFSSMDGIVYQHTARASMANAQTFMALSMKRLGLESGGAVPSSGLALNNFAATHAGATFLGDDSGSDRVPGWWASALGGLGKYRGNSVDSGASAPLGGLALGVDTPIGNNVTLGAEGGEAEPQVVLDDADDKTRTHLFQMGAYGRVKKAQSRLDAAINFGTLGNRTSRSITDGTFAPSSSASYGGTSVASQLEYGYGLGVWRGLFIEPQAGFQYTRLAFDGATEQGGGVLSLIVPERRVRSERMLAGARVAKSFNGSDGWTIEGRASWAHELMPLRDLHLRFVGDTVTNGFDLAAPNQLRDSGVLGFSLLGKPGRGFRFFAGIDAEVSGPATSWSSNIGVNRSW